MKKPFVFIMLSLFLLGTYNNVFADYKILLKNGGKFIVNDYKKEGNSIKFYTPNGEIEIDQNNIENIKSVDIEEDANEPTAKPEKENIKTDENKKSVVKSTEDPFNFPIKVKTPEGKTSDMEKKENELKAEKTKLQEEAKKLKEDIKKEGTIMSVRKKREFDKRTSELDKKFESHDQKIKQYNKEYDNLLKEPK